MKANSSIVPCNMLSTFKFKSFLWLLENEFRKHTRQSSSKFYITKQFKKPFIKIGLLIIIIIKKNSSHENEQIKLENKLQRAIIYISKLINKDYE